MVIGLAGVQSPSDLTLQAVVSLKTLIFRPEAQGTGWCQFLPLPSCHACGSAALFGNAPWTVST